HPAVRRTGRRCAAGGSRRPGAAAEVQVLYVMRGREEHLGEGSTAMSAQADRIFRHPACYARELGDCSTAISKEHYVSAVVLRGVSLGEPTVLVQNLSFQQPGTVESKGISGLVAKVLCEKHNSALSGFDGAGNTLFAGMDGIDSAVGKAGVPA